MNANPATGPKLRVTPSALVLPLANLATLALILVAITSGGIAIVLAAIGVLVWVVLRACRSSPAPPG